MPDTHTRCLCAFFGWGCFAIIIASSIAIIIVTIVVIIIASIIVIILVVIEPCSQSPRAQQRTHEPIPCVRAEAPRGHCC